MEHTAAKWIQAADMIMGVYLSQRTEDRALVYTGKVIASATGGRAHQHAGMERHASDRRRRRCIW